MNTARTEGNERTRPVILRLELRALRHGAEPTAVEDGLRAWPGVLDVMVDVRAGMLRLEVDPERFVPRALGPGFSVEPGSVGP